MLCIVLGNVGTGKTLFLTMIGKHSQLKIVSNYTLNYKYDDFDVDKFIKAEYDNCSIFLDEAYTYLESRVSLSELNRLMSYILFQSRKKSLNIYLTAQLLSTIDKRFRQMANIIITCNNNERMQRYEYTIFYRDIQKTIKINLDYQKAEQYYNLYDTNQVIQPPNTNNYFVKKLNGKDRMDQIKQICEDLKEEYQNKRITKGFVDLFILENDLPSFLAQNVFSYLQLHKKITRKKKSGKKAKR